MRARRRILIPLPNTGSMYRKRHTYYIRGIIVVSFVIFLFLQLHTLTYTDNRDAMLTEPTNYSTDAILSQVPVDLHKFLKPKVRNNSKSLSATNFLRNSNGSSLIASLVGAVGLNGNYTDGLNIKEIKRQIAKHNREQLVLNEDIFGPLQNDSVIIVVQVHTRITYLRHLIVSLAQSTDISKTLLIFSHDFYDEDINELVQSIDFCKVMQIFYPFSIQTHPFEFPGVDPNDCPRDIKKDQAIIQNCNNALYPDLYGHYREAKFTQTKHHWWWKANRVFDQLRVTRNHLGLVLFLEEDHYVAEDFLYLLEMMQQRTADLCPNCNILSLGTYLKTFNYYTYNNKNHKKPLGGPYATLISANKLLLKSKSSSSNSNKNKNNNNNVNNNYIKSTRMQNDNMKNLTQSSQASFATSYTPLSLLTSSLSSLSSGSGTAAANSAMTNNNPRISKLTTTTTTTTTTKTTTTKMTNTDKSVAQQTWSYHVLPSLYSVYQKVEVTPWVSSKHNMGFAFNRITWNTVVKCAPQFCAYDDYNWDWSLQHVSQQCMEKKLQAMIVKGPRVFHIGECGVHHKKNNCESNQVISKVQQVLRIARQAGQLYPRSLTFTVSSVVKRTKMKKGNGGWGDQRDHELCVNMTRQHV